VISGCIEQTWVLAESLTVTVSAVFVSLVFEPQDVNKKANNRLEMIVIFMFLIVKMFLKNILIDVILKFMIVQDFSHFYYHQPHAFRLGLVIGIYDKALETNFSF
jgi:hypothetical protein